VPAVGLIWADSIQSGGEPYGFDEFLTESPIDNVVTPRDGNGANLSRVPDPLGGPGYAIREYGNFAQGGARSELGLWSFNQPEFSALVLSGAPVYVAQEWYFPKAIDAGGDDWPWLNLWDWHSVSSSDRWHTDPGLMLAKDGSMRVRWEWGGDPPNVESGYSSIGFPVGEWFDIEMKYQWSSNKDVTLKLWVNGVLVLKEANVQTAAASHDNVEMYIKWYGDDQGHTPWSPTPTVKYVRNVRISGQRIWQ